VASMLCTHVKYLLNRHSLGASVQGGRCVVARTLCAQREYFLNRNSLGHLLREDAVLWDARCVLMGSIFEIDTPWGIPSGWTLCSGTCAVCSREVFLK
jgi:hypothetical protein